MEKNKKNKKRNMYEILSNVGDSVRDKGEYVLYAVIPLAAKFIYDKIKDSKS